MSRARRRDLFLVAGPFLISGIIHLVRPQVFEPIVPKVLLAKRELVIVSGAAELACAAGLLHPRTRPLAGKASAFLLGAVFPVNVQMAADAWSNRKSSGVLKWGCSAGYRFRSH